MVMKKRKGCPPKFSPFGDEGNIHPEESRTLEFLGLNGQPLTTKVNELEYQHPAQITVMMSLIENTEGVSSRYLYGPLLATNVTKCGSGPKRKE